MAPRAGRGVRDTITAPWLTLRRALATPDRTGSALRRACGSLARTGRALRRDVAGVTPVIGSILVLGITVLGIAGVLVWGGPTLAAIQDQNSLVAMRGEFNELRRDTTVLTIVDSSRVPTINVESGVFGTETGSRFLVSAMHDPDAGNAYDDCDMHIVGWDDSDVDTVTARMAGMCRDPQITCVGLLATQSCFRVFKVTGSNLVEQTVTVTPSGSDFTLDVAGADFSSGDWLFELGNGDETRYQEAWLLSTHQIRWDRQSTAGSLATILEGGAIFRFDDGTYFLDASPGVNEEAFSTTDFVMRLPAYSGTKSTIQGEANPSMFLGLVGNHLRVTQEDTTIVRLDFQGTLAESWCNTMMLRNGRLQTGAYTEDPAYPCDAAGTGQRGVIFQKTSGPDEFAFEFIHARITTVLQT